MIYKFHKKQFIENKNFNDFSCQIPIEWAGSIRRSEWIDFTDLSAGIVRNYQLYSQFY
jgi:hypothetical protein